VPTPVRIPAELAGLVVAWKGEHATDAEIEARLRARGCKAGRGAIRGVIERAAKPVPKGYRTAPADIADRAEEAEADLEAHKAARKAWVAMLKQGGLRPDELERAQKGLVRASSAIRQAQAQLGKGTDDNPETSLERLMAKIDEMASRMKRPVLASNQVEKQEVDPPKTAESA
jgi:Zn-finger nucleic acid-binding protein